MAASAPPDGSDTVGKADVAAQLYLALRVGDLAAATRCVTEASDADLLQPSTWKQRQPATCLQASSRHAPYATWDLSAVHVLVRDCHETALVRRGIVRVPHALGARGGHFKEGTEAQWLPIHMAASYNHHVDVVRSLLEVGGAEQLQVKDCAGLLPFLQAASFNSNVEVLLLLLEVGGDEQLQAKDSEGRLSVHRAAFSNNSVEVMRLLLLSRLAVGGPKQLQVKDNDGRLPIHWVVVKNTVEVVQFLLEVGGSEQLQVKDSDDDLPIHVAASLNSSVEVVRFLLEVGGVEQLQVKDSRGQLPIHLASLKNSSVEVVRFLLEVGGAEQLQATNSDGQLPIHLAASMNSSVQVVRLLLEVGGAEQLQVKDSNGRLPIHLASLKNSSMEVVRLLLGLGSPRTSTSISAVSYAIEREREDIARLLIEAGCRLSPDLRLPQQLHEVASVSSVLLSYFADNLSPLAAAVRRLL